MWGEETGCMEGDGHGRRDLGTEQFGHGSVQLRFGGGTVRVVPVLGSRGSSGIRGFSVFQHSLTERDGSGSWKMVPAALVPLPAPGPDSCKSIRRFARIA